MSGMTTEYGDMIHLPDGLAAWVDYDDDEDLVAVFVDDVGDKRRVLKCLNREGLPVASQLMVIESVGVNEWDEVYAGNRGDLEDAMRFLINSDEWTPTWVTSSEEYWDEASHYDMHLWYFPRDVFDGELPVDVYAEDVESKFEDN